MKTYNQPAVTVVELKLKSNILIGSEITDIDTNLGTGDDIDFATLVLVMTLISVAPVVTYQL